MKTQYLLMKWGLCCYLKNFRAQKKKNPTLSKLKTVTGKKPQMSEKQMKKQMSSQLHNQKKARE